MTILRPTLGTVAAARPSRFRRELRRMAFFATLPLGQQRRYALGNARLLEGAAPAARAALQRSNAVCGLRQTAGIGRFSPLDPA